MNGLNKITERILFDAKEKAREILETAQSECREIAESYAAKAEELRDEISAAAEAEGEALISRAKSAAAMTRRNLLLSARAALIDETFAAAGRELRDDSFGKYRELLVALLLSAVADQVNNAVQSAAFGDDLTEFDALEVLMNEQDRARYGNAVVEDARREVRRRFGTELAGKLVLSEDVADVDGGLVLRYGSIEANCSLSMLISRMREELEREVAAVLFADCEVNF